MTIYVPILKDKQGEWSALGDLAEDVASACLPLIQLEEGTTPDKLLERIQKRRPTGDALIQASPVDPKFWSAALVRDTAQLVPVIRTASGSRERQAVATAARRRKRVAVRLSGEDFDDLDMLRTLLADISSPAAEVDLIVDIGAFHPGQGTMLARGAAHTLLELGGFGPWRSLTLASTNYPEDLRAFKVDVLTRVPREDWSVWMACRKKAPGPLGFGDYGIQHPVQATVDPKFMNVPASIRYSTASDYVMLRGRGTKDVGWGHIRPRAKQLMASDGVYSGEDYSVADKMIASCAAGGNTGNGTTWRRIGMGHHITMVVRELASLPDA